jgi:hypothetical protein
MLGDAADYKHFPDIRFNQNTTKSVMVRVHEMKTRREWPSIYHPNYPNC